jgi:hypothetical protein
MVKRFYFFMFFSGLSNYTMQQQQQRGMTGPQFRGTSQGHVTPTSMHLPLVFMCVMIYWKSGVYQSKYK